MLLGGKLATVRSPSHPATQPPNRPPVQLGPIPPARPGASYTGPHTPYTRPYFSPHTSPHTSLHKSLPKSLHKSLHTPDRGQLPPCIRGKWRLVHMAIGWVGGGGIAGHGDYTQPVRVDPFWCNSTNRQNSLIQQSCHNFWSNDVILMSLKIVNDLNQCDIVYFMNGSIISNYFSWSSWI